MKPTAAVAAMYFLITLSNYAELLCSITYLCWNFVEYLTFLGEGFSQFQNQLIFSRGRVLSIWEINQNQRTGSSSDFQKLKELLGFMKECLAKRGRFWATLIFQKCLRSMCDLKGSELDKVIV
jgi:hypothetical protein